MSHHQWWFSCTCQKEVSAQDTRYVFQREIVLIFCYIWYADFLRERSQHSTTVELLLSSSKPNLHHLPPPWLHLKLLSQRLGSTIYLTCKIHEVQSWSSWNFLHAAMLRNTCILPRNANKSSWHRNEPPHAHCSTKWAALTCLHLSQTRSCKW